MICYSCNGSGEGRHRGTRCMVCMGLGEFPTTCADCGDITTNDEYLCAVCERTREQEEE